MKNIKADDIFKALKANLEPQIIENGFKLYKGKSFLRITNGVIQIIKVSCHKHDIHMWYACYPLCEKDIWFGAATKSTGGRLPEEEKAIKILDAESLKKSLVTFTLLYSDILEFFKKRSSLKLLEASIEKDDLIYPGLIKAYCLAKLGSFKEANEYLKVFINSELSELSKEGAVELFESIQNGKTDNVLESNTLENIKKLGLKRYV